MRIAIVVAVLAAGCLSGPTDSTVLEPPAGTDWWRDAIPDQASVAGHKHDVQSMHEGLSTPNFNLLGHDALVTDHYGAGAGTYFCGEKAELEGRTLAAYNSFSSEVALVIVDVTDPTAPILLGELVLPSVQTYDAALADDGSFAVLATNSAQAPSGESSRVVTPVWRDACGVEHLGQPNPVPYANGVVLVDLADLTQPVVSDYRAIGAIGAHSVSETTIDGVAWIIASSTNLVHQASSFHFYNVQATPVGPRLLEQGAFDAQYPTSGLDGNAPALINGHVDASIQRHPITGQLLGYLANWDGGMVIVEVVGLGVITPVSEWRGFGSVHEALPQQELLDGRHVTLIGQEVGGRPSEELPTGYMAIMDTTDPANPTAVAWWTLPVQSLDWTGVGFLGFSTHYPDLHDGVLFVSTYHGGVWAADADPVNWPALPTIGAFVPASPIPSDAATGALAPEVLDVLALEDGTLIIPDSTSGVYVVQFDRSVAVEPAPALPLEPAWIG